MALVEDGTQRPRGPSLVIQLGVLGVLTVAAIGSGWFAGDFLGKGQKPAEAPAPAAHAAPSHGEEGEEAANPLLVPLAPMTTNLSAPNSVWVRLELALLLNAPLTPPEIETIHQDLFAFLKTVKLHQIEGPSGYQHLIGDLQERARIRSDNKVDQVLMRTMLFE
jgi:flagellar FliL protein